MISNTFIKIKNFTPNKKTKKSIPSGTVIFTALIMFLCTIMAFDSHALELPEDGNMKAGYLYNIETDTVLYTYNENDVIYPTSTVKLMTGILAIEALGSDLAREIIITDEMRKGVAGNNIDLKTGEVVTVENMLNALLIGSSNDAAQVLAITVSGSIEAFVGAMNTKAKEIGAVNTFYMNPTGLHSDGMVTTAYDTFLIARYAYGINMLMEITSTPKYVMEATNKSVYRTIYNRNFMIAKNQETRYYYPGAAGMNAGSTTQGGFSVVTTAMKEGLTYLCVVMGSEKVEKDDTNYSYVEAAKLLDWAFENYGYRQIISSSDMVCEIPVELSTTVDYVTLVPSESLSVFLPMDVDIEKDIIYSYKTISETLQAPVTAGQTAGMITIMYEDKILGSIDLIATSSISRSEFLFILARIQKFTGSRFFIATVISAIILSIVYVIGQSISRHKQAQKRNRYR